MSKVEIYYFSGTGNSLTVARDIAEKTNGKLIAVPSVMDQDNIITDADLIGIVFPVFYATNDSGIPLIIGRFVGKLEKIDSKYIFAVCTSGYMAGETIENLAKMIRCRGGKLAAGFVVNMSNQSLSNELQQKMDKLLDGKSDTGPTKNMDRGEMQQKKLNEKLELIAETVNARKEAKLETRGILGKIIFAPLLLLIKPVFKMRYQKLSQTSHLPFRDLIPLADRSFRTNEKCNQCGICAKVCPVNNIKIVSGRPEWQHHCETCYGCYQWCPQEAIYGEIVKYNERYHHPDVKISDMLR